jgi:hypothetical protein
MAKFKEALETGRSSQVINPAELGLLNEAEFEELAAPNKPSSRLFVPTEKLEPTPLNDKRV